MKNCIKRALMLIITLSLLSAMLNGCSAGADSEKTKTEDSTGDDSIEVRVENPGRRDVSISSNFAATVEADSTVKVIPMVAGEVIEKYFEVGDHVNEGDLLFKIDDENARIQFDQAKANVDSANAGYTAQQAATASTKAQATETIAKISSNEAQLNFAVDSAYAQKRAAGNTWENARYSEDYYEDEYYTAKDDLHDMKKDKKKLKKQREELEDLMNAYESKLREGGEDKAKEFLRSNGYSTFTELKTDLNSVASAYSAADSAIDQYENAIKSYDLQKRSNGNSADSAEMNYYTAEENVALAEQNRAIYNAYTKATTLFGVNAQVVGADASLINSEVNVRQAKASLHSAEMALDHYTVTSPVSGTIKNIGISLHNFAGTGTEAYTIETDNMCKIVFYVAEETVKAMERGNAAIVTRNGVKYDARITDVGTTIDQDTGLFKIEAVVSNGADQLLTGSSVSVRTVTRQEKNVISVPGEAVYYDDEQPYVFLSDGKQAVRRDVEIGISDDEGIAVLSGLSTDDDLIVSWSSQLRDGAPIRLIKNEKTGSISDPSEIRAGSAIAEAS